MEFKVIKQAVANQFKHMCNKVQLSGGSLFRTTVDKDLLWSTYLESFPEGTNPMFRERTEHDCSCCRAFIRAIGDVVALTEDGVMSIWDVDVVDKEPGYQVVADALATLVKSYPIENVFLTTEKKVGTDKNFEEVINGTPLLWEHFFVNVPHSYVVRKDVLGTKLGDSKALHDVLKRSLDELTEDSVEVVLDLIAQNSIYRGKEYEHAVQSFSKLKQSYKNVEDAKKDTFVWYMTTVTSPSVCKIRNTAIGTLLIDISNGVDLEGAVHKFEKVVAPENYQRTTALITPVMIKKAEAKVEELGLTSALGRRYAVMTDINVNDILFADRTAKKSLTGSVFDELSSGVADKKPKNMDKVDEISMEDFIHNVLPKVNSMELYVENQHVKNLVSLIAPTDDTAGKLFKWNNNFSWSYNGDMADSIKEKVKAAGGNVTGDLCCRLAWYNYDDLDLHMLEPSGEEIYYGHKRSNIGGRLDVDMNAGHGTTREPVENIYYENKARMQEGVYTLFVHQYSQRESTNVGFEIEIDFMGTVYHFVYDKSVKGKVVVAKFSYSHKDGIKLIESLPCSTAAKEVWGIITQKYHKVNLMMYSPNYWESTGTGVGNKHYMFILEDCVNPEAARGFFNEYLNENLREHRKVFEVLGSKCKAEFTPEQLSGLGFSSTQHTSILCRVSGSFNRVLKITI